MEVSDGREAMDGGRRMVEQTEMLRSLSPWRPLLYSGSVDGADLGYDGGTARPVGRRGTSRSCSSKPRSLDKTSTQLWRQEADAPHERMTFVFSSSFVWSRRV